MCSRGTNLFFGCLLVPISLAGVKLASENPSTDPKTAELTPEPDIEVEEELFGVKKWECEVVDTVAFSNLREQIRGVFRELRGLVEVTVNLLEEAYFRGHPLFSR